MTAPDNDEFIRRTERYRPELLAHCYRMLGSLADAEDAVQETYVRDSVRLALIASLQYLPSRQRAVLILRDVLAWPAAEVADLLDMSVAAVKSTLQRARARLRQAAPATDHVAQLTEPQHRALLGRYIAAFQNADAAALEELLRQDATLEAPPLRTWYAGIASCLPYMTAHVLGSPGHWRMRPASANGQPAVAAYYRGSDGSYLPYGIVVLTATTEGISRITSFGDPGLVTAFGFPAGLPAGDGG